MVSITSLQVYTLMRVSGADLGFEKGGFNLVPNSDPVAPLMMISENTTRGQLQKTKGFSLEIQLSMLLTKKF